jgi:hypothetical protein
MQREGMMIRAPRNRQGSAPFGVKASIATNSALGGRVSLTGRSTNPKDMNQHGLVSEGAVRSTGLNAFIARPRTVFVR